MTTDPSEYRIVFTIQRRDGRTGAFTDVGCDRSAARPDIATAAADVVLIVASRMWEPAAGMPEPGELEDGRG